MVFELDREEGEFSRISMMMSRGLAYYRSIKENPEATELDFNCYLSAFLMNRVLSAIVITENYSGDDYTEDNPLAFTSKELAQSMIDFPSTCRLSVADYERLAKALEEGLEKIL